MGANTFCNYDELDNELKDSFQDRKLFGKYLVKSYNRLGMSEKSEKVKNCGSSLDFDELRNGKYKLQHADFCKNRLCPMCAWRRSKKIFSQVYKVMEYIQNDYQFILLTLTVSNVSSDLLASKINDMQKGFRKLIQRKSIKRILKGYFRALEITYNRKRDDYHPHFHVIFAVPKDYFVSDDYIKRDEFLKLWQQSMKDDSISQVDVRKIKIPNYSDTSINVDLSTALAKAVAEVAKYTVKSSDYIFTDSPMLTDKVVFTFDSVLYNRRLASFGGVFSDARDELGLDDVENGDLVHADVEKVKEDEVVRTLKFRWRGGKYKLTAIVYPEKLLLATPEDDLLFDDDTGEILEE